MENKEELENLKQELDLLYTQALKVEKTARKIKGSENTIDLITGDMEALLSEITTMCNAVEEENKK